MFVMFSVLDRLFIKCKYFPISSSGGAQVYVKKIIGLQGSADNVTIGFLVIEFFHAYASKYNIQRRKLSSAKRKHYQFSFSHP